jgi:putative acetyltransferase
MRGILEQMPVVVKRAGLDSPDAVELIEALNAELLATYPEPGATHFRLDPDEVAAGRGGFFVAWEGGRAVGCGAVRRIDERTAELKRMYVRPEERGRGISRALLTALEDEARRLGLSRVCLETGTRQLAALALYERSGFVRVDAYGEYGGSALSVCFAKSL